MSDVKQILVVRRDLNMRKGKIASQCAHASMKVFFDRMRKQPRESYPNSVLFFDFDWIVDMTPEMIEWKEGIFTKICVSVDSETELLDIHEKAKAAGIPTALIQDCGKTEFNGVPTYTCVAVGPDTCEKIDPITGGLKLL